MELLKNAYCPRASALGGLYSALPSDLLALFGNVANLTKHDQLKFSVIFSRPFGLKELSHSGLALAIPSKYGSFGLAVSRFGFSLYRESLLSFGYANNPYKNIYFGISLNVMEVRTRLYITRILLIQEYIFMNMTFRVY